MKSQTRKSVRFVNCLCARALLLSLPSPGAPATLAWYFLELARLSSDYRQQKRSSEGLDWLVSLMEKTEVLKFWALNRQERSAKI